MLIVYNSYHGRFSDSPRALYERLRGIEGLDHVWLAHEPHLSGFPSGVRTVDIESTAARRTLEDADLLVANSHTELEWRKSPTTTYLQTWHGTPLKRIHRDVLWAPEGRLDRLDRDVAKWDLLVSPNSDSTPRLRHAFRYDGEVLEIGYPRNDVLVGPNRDEVRASVRARLGIPEEDVVVLYAPTWRDQETFREGEPELQFPLDVAECSAALGPGHWLLARLHPLNTGRSRIPAVPGVVDVSLYPEVSDLYLAADVLVTDYSSAMFDFAVTGKPIVFYAFDLDMFREQIRGFYFDFVPEAPGPVVRRQGEVLEALADLPSLEDEYAARYARFRARYCAWEDGQATDRLLLRLGLSAPVTRSA